MGLNIILVKVTGIETAKGWNNHDDVYFNYDKQTWFDSLRHSGDRDFVMGNEMMRPFPQDTEDHFARPKDFEKAKEWVKSNVFEGNQPRLLKCLEEMQKDDKLCFIFSW